MRKALVILLLIATVAVVPTAEAKNRDKSWEFGAFVAHIDGDRSELVDNGIAAEIRIGYNFSSKIAAELSFSNEDTEQGRTRDLVALGTPAIPEPGCPADVFVTTPTCVSSVGSAAADLDRDVTFRRAVLSITGSFLTDRETRTTPYISAGLGFIQETRADFPFDLSYQVSIDDGDPNTPRVTGTRSVPGESLESFDSSAVLMLSVGARTFFTDNWGARYEVGYAHHDSFGANQDEYAVKVGITWVVGGQK